MHRSGDIMFLARALSVFFGKEARSFPFSFFIKDFGNCLYSSGRNRRNSGTGTVPMKLISPRDGFLLVALEEPAEGFVFAS
jgi:hypothetical protein